MSAVPFRQGREGLYCNLGMHTILVARRKDGYEVSLDGYAQETGLGFRPAQEKAQALAQGFRAHLIAEGQIDDPDEMSQTAHPAPTDGADHAPTTNPSKETTVTTKTETKTETKTATKTTAKATPKARAPRAPRTAAKPLSTRETVTQGFAKGETVADMAKALGVSQGRVRQILMDTGLIKPTSRNPERDARIVEAIDSGESPAVVAEREGVKEFRVRWIHKVAKAGAA